MPNNPFQGINYKYMLEDWNKLFAGFFWMITYLFFPNTFKFYNSKHYLKKAITIYKFYLLVFNKFKEEVQRSNIS